MEHLPNTASTGTPRQLRQPGHPFLRGLLITAWSVASGAWFGMLAAGVFMASVLPAGLVMGAVVGLLLAPLAVAVLWRTPLLGASLIVVVPVSLVAACTGSVEPCLSIVTVPIFCTMLLFARIMTPQTGRMIPPGTCSTCGYDTTGLVRCPECGTPCPMHVDLRTAP